MKSAQISIGPLAILVSGLVLVIGTLQIGPKNALAFAGQATVAPQEVEPLHYGDNVQHEFVDDTPPFLFSFEAQTGDLISVTMVAVPDTALDPALEVLDANGQVIAQNADSLDASFGLLNARLINFPIPAEGLYLIRARRETADNGGFTLTLRGVHAPAGNAQVPLLTYGQAAQGEITAQVVRSSYRFQASVGDTISVIVQSLPGSALVPYVALFGPQGDKLTSSNPAEQTLKTARITRYPVREEGTYTLVISRTGEAAGTTTGAFRVVLSRDASAPRLKLGDTVRGQIDDTQSEAVYLVEIDASERLSIAVTRESGTLNPTLVLQRMDGQVLASGTVGDGQAQISDFQAPDGGVFMLIVSRQGKAGGTTAGNFALSVKQSKVAPRAS